MGVKDHLGEETDSGGTTTGSTSWALIERAPWGANAQSYIGTGDLYGAANAALNDPRSGTWTMQLSGSDRNARATFGTLPVGTQQEIDRIAKLYNANSTGEALFSKAMAGSAAATKAGKPMTVFEWLSNYAAQFGAAGVNGPGGRGPGGGGGGGYAGPTTSVSYDPAAKPDVRAIADGVAQEMLGRVVTDDELQRIMKRVRKYEEANPSVRVSDSQPGSNVSRTTAPGATNAGRQEIVEKLLAKNPDFVPYQMNHTVYDAMLGVMQRGQEIANG